MRTPAEETLRQLRAVAWVSKFPRWEGCVMPYCRWERREVNPADLGVVALVGLAHTKNLQPGVVPHTLSGDPIDPEPWSRPSRVTRPILSLLRGEKS
jgi:hypothetical protein